jgi:hypothetical protein
MRVSWSRYQAHKRGIKKKDTLVSFDPYHTGFCGHRNENLGWRAGRDSLEDKAVKLFGIVLVR